MHKQLKVELTSHALQTSICGLTVGSYLLCFRLLNHNTSMIVKILQRNETESTVSEN